MRRLIALYMLAVVLLCGASTGASAVEYYSRDITIPYLDVVTDLSNQGQVIGCTQQIPGMGPARGFIWNTRTGGVDYIAGTSNRFVVGINGDGNVIAGAGIFGRQPFAWVDGVERQLWTLSPDPAPLGIATAANNKGQICGNLGTTGHATFWSRPSGDGVDLGTLAGGHMSWACDINEAGEVIGGSDDSSGRNRPVRWDTGGGILPLDELFGSTSTRVNAINSSGLIVGAASFSGRDVPVCWLADGSIRELSLLPGANSGYARGINDFGQIVGYSDDKITLWNADGSMQEIAGLANAASGYVVAINNSGEVAGLVTDALGVKHAVLYAPVPEPSTLLLAALCGLGGLTMLRRRRMAL